MNNPKAREGQWYSDHATHDTFCVIGVDEEDGLIGVRDDHGDVDEFDFDEWELMDLHVCAAPNDWTLASDGADGEEFPEPRDDVSHSIIESSGDDSPAGASQADADSTRSSIAAVDPSEGAHERHDDQYGNRDHREHQQRKQQ
ncbi:MAG: DUF6763 family protein [Steroidobacter sp.]